jgi:hypothetical protein
MTDTGTTSENEALSGTVLRIIDAYAMGTVLDVGNLAVKKTARAAPERVHVQVEDRELSFAAR